jgi:hypothetical protein
LNDFFTTKDRKKKRKKKLLEFKICGRFISIQPPTDPPARDEFADAATIVFAKDRLVTVGQDHVVFIDHGDDQSLVPGDILAVYRVPAKNAPPIALGEIAILSVQPHTSVAKVVSSRHPMYVGDLAIVD